jgi:hypothetical protein
MNQRENSPTGIAHHQIEYASNLHTSRVLPSLLVHTDALKFIASRIYLVLHAASAQTFMSKVLLRSLCLRPYYHSTVTRGDDVQR